ncbi:MAG: hypothetical protein RBU30_27695 [Polyangia bacterium]|jgi:hypothetical protein|nr:hypothetical protein [Polyangia bacterium]
METPSKDTATSELLIQGAYHQAGLAHLEETAGKAEAFAKVQEELKQAFETRLAAEQVAAAARARMLHVDVEADALLLALGDAVADADTALHGVLFPAGMERVVGPVGAVQTEAMKGILERFGKAEQPAAKALREGWSAPLGEALSRYEDAIAQQGRAQSDLEKARSRETKAREAWFEAVKAHLAIIAEQYPDSDFTRALFFPAGS